MLGLGVSVKSFGVRNRIQVKVRSMVGNSEGTKRLGTKMLGVRNVWRQIYGYD